MGEKNKESSRDIGSFCFKFNSKREKDKKRRKRRK
jgi:hypothetical protein